MGWDGGVVGEGEDEGTERLNQNLCLSGSTCRKEEVVGRGVSKAAASLITMATDAEQAAMAFYILGEI